MISVSAATIRDIKTRVDPDSGKRVFEHACRASQVENNVVDGYFTFATDCQTSGNSYTQIVQFQDWATVVPPDVDPNMPLVTVMQTYPETQGLNVQVDCTCPAFSYWGHRYNLDRDQSSVYQSEPYTTNNPDSRYSCKHLAAVYHTFFY